VTSTSGSDEASGIFIIKTKKVENRRQKAVEKPSLENLSRVGVNGVGAERDCLLLSASRLHSHRQM
jgi:hypothetical protein